MPIRLMRHIDGQESTVEHPAKGKTGPRRIWNAFGYSLAGLASACRNEAAFRQELLLAVILAPAAMFMPVSLEGRALMVASVFLVLVVELLNSAIEATVDRVSLENHFLAKRAKDLGSAAVFLSLVNLVVVWLLLLFA